MSISFDTNILVYATAPAPAAKADRAREILLRGMHTGGLLLLQTLCEFSSVAIRKAGIPIRDVQKEIEAWRAVLPIHAAEYSDLSIALDAVKAHRLAFWDAMLWASARRVGVRYFLTEDMQDGFELDRVKYVNPFREANDELIDEILPP